MLIRPTLLRRQIQTHLYSSRIDLKKIEASVALQVRHSPICLHFPQRRPKHRRPLGFCVRGTCDDKFRSFTSPSPDLFSTPAARLSDEYPSLWISVRRRLTCALERRGLENARFPF
ncbi:hypothetical protein AVEN_214558-1 [Araneus ventricosus]|uniref:Uncharacterized protein n=1 Tax=Araneus ventricosus TaxID=182803 RepID=A0A4Y2LLC1_ARAVE|nr:hypothetical protein AVEN_214558-1 [Araneus ventricosus]